METGKKDKNKFLFNIDILIEEENNGRALEKLLHMLNTTDIQDYRIKEGIQLGKSIEIALRENMHKKKLSYQENQEQPQASQKIAEAPAKAGSAPASKADSNPSVNKEDPHHFIWEQFYHFKQNNSLIRLTVVKGKGIKLSIPCRILNIDPENGNVSVYHVDEKQVYLFNMNEIDDFVVTA